MSIQNASLSSNDDAHMAIGGDYLFSVQTPKIHCICELEWKRCLHVLLPQSR